MHVHAPSRETLVNWFIVGIVWNKKMGELLTCSLRVQEGLYPALTYMLIRSQTLG